MPPPQLYDVPFVENLLAGVASHVEDATALLSSIEQSVYLSKVRMRGSLRRAPIHVYLSKVRVHKGALC